MQLFGSIQQDIWNYIIILHKNIPVSERFTKIISDL